MAGKDNLVANALSRSPLEGTFRDDEETGPFDITRQTIDFQFEMTRKDPLFAKLFRAAEEDTKYIEVVDAIKRGKSLKELESGHPAHQLGSVWQHLSLIDNEPHPLILLEDHRIVIPQSQRKHILETLHIPHRGVSSTQKHARSYFYWPGMDKQIEEHIQGCEACLIFSQSRQREPAVTEDVNLCDLQAMDYVSIDFGVHAGKNFLVCVDRLSWPNGSTYWAGRNPCVRITARVSARDSPCGAKTTT